MVTKKRSKNGHPSLHRHRERAGKEGQVLHRSKRGWVWNQFFVIEEYTGPDPVLVGRLHSDVDSGKGRCKYILSGEGAGTIFVIDDNTGNIHATKTLDREEQAQYTLTAQAVDRDTNKPLEPPSEFIVKVQDINDNPPEFLHRPYFARVPEMSNVGTSVMQVTATDADDPTYGNSARLVYSILQGQPYFSVESQTGIIRTALPNMDREARQEYDVVIQAKDMGGHMGGLSGTTEVKITLTDVNDNPPKFPQSVYTMSVSEDKVSGEEVGRLKAKDPDQGENGLMVDYETKRTYMLRIEGSNPHVDPRFTAWGPYRDEATVKIMVEDADEPPVFVAPSYNFEVEENAPAGTQVGRVHAKDTDVANNPVRYMIPRYTDVEQFFSVNSEDGMITTTRPLDREAQAWHNISVAAAEIDDYIPVESSFTSPNAEVSRLRSELHSIEILLGDILQRQSLLLSRLDALHPAAVPSIVDPALRVPFGDVSLGGPLSAWRAVVGRRSLPLFAPEEDDSPIPLDNFFAPLEMLSDTEPATEEQSTPEIQQKPGVPPGAGIHRGRGSPPTLEGLSGCNPGKPPRGGRSLPEVQSSVARPPKPAVQQGAAPLQRTRKRCTSPSPPGLHGKRRRCLSPIGTPNFGHVSPGGPLTPREPVNAEANHPASPATTDDVMHLGSSSQLSDPVVTAPDKSHTNSPKTCLFTHTMTSQLLKFSFLEIL
ncbi:unnamed protein product [Arctogadus glacialis]